jgi:hypothetical protein
LQIDQAIEARSGMTLIKPSSLQPPTLIARSNEAGFRRTSKTSTWRKDSQAPVNGGDGSETELRASNGSVFTVEVTGDVQISEEDGSSSSSSSSSGGGAGDNVAITYYQGMAQNCRRFTLSPKVANATDGPKVKLSPPRVQMYGKELPFYKTHLLFMLLEQLPQSRVSPVL